MFNTNDPKLPFYVESRANLDAKSLQILINLYQPLVGANGVSVYLTLNLGTITSPLKSDFNRLYQLQEKMDLDLPSVLTAIHQLEAVNLIKTYQNTNQVLGPSLQFELIDVLTPSEFFDTYLLSGLLLEKIGEAEFKKIKQLFKKENTTTKLGEDVSATFFDVFHVNQERAINPPELVTDTAKEFNQNQPQAPDEAANPDLIDWEFLALQLEAYNINESVLEENRVDISQMIKFFDLTELDFIKAATVTLNPGDTQLDMKKIKNVLLNQQPKTPVATPKNATGMNANQVIKDLDQEDQKNLKEMLNQTALNYLQNLKHQKGGYVSSSEKSIIYQLHNVYKLSDELINAISFTVLNMTSILNKNLVDSIANDWLQHGITTAAAALVYVKDRNQKQTRPKNKFSSYKKVEVGTDWDQAKPTTDKNSDDDNLDDLLKKLSD